MENFKVHTIETAPEKSKGALEALKNNFGFIPNLAATMAESSVLLNGFLGAFGNFHGSSFTGDEKQILLTTNAVTNGCEWAVAFHSTLALKEGASPSDVDAIREGKLPSNKKYAALSHLTKSLIEKRGHLSTEDLNRFTSAGFKKEQIFEVIAGLSVSTMANFAGNIAHPSLEDAFKPQKWTRMI